MRMKFLAAALLLGAAVFGCGDDDDANGGEAGLVEQLEAAGLGQYLGGDLPTPTQLGDWLRYAFPVTDGGPQCIFGTEYVVYVRPGTNDNVLFYLEGGGACWNDETCFGNSGLGAKTTSEPFGGEPPTFAGILGRGPGNPIDGWNVVYAPYCDGSVFSGDNVAEYDSGTAYHFGQINISAAIDVMRENYPDPETIMVSGSSAGGYGTYPGYGNMRVAYPDEFIYVLNDSGPGLQNNDDQVSIAERRENWRFEEYIVDGCTECDEQPSYLTDWALDNDPNTRAALFSYTLDFVISDFNMLERPQYRSLLLDVSGEINDRHPDRFKRFLVEGEAHTILLGAGVSPNGPVGTEGFFNTLEIDGVLLPDWIADFVSDGPEWRDLVE